MVIGAAHASWPLTSTAGVVAPHAARGGEETFDPADVGEQLHGERLHAPPVMAESRSIFTRS